MRTGVRMSVLGSRKYSWSSQCVSFRVGDSKIKTKGKDERFLLAVTDGGISVIQVFWVSSAGYNQRIALHVCLRECVSVSSAI